MSNLIHANQSLYLFFSSPLFCLGMNINLDSDHSDDFDQIQLKFGQSIKNYIIGVTYVKWHSVGNDQGYC